jgi:hypothetical protein
MSELKEKINCLKKDCKGELQPCLAGNNGLKSYICNTCDTEFYDKGDGKPITKEEWFEHKEKFNK